jgi:hypothetical protein
MLMGLKGGQVLPSPTEARQTPDDPGLNWVDHAKIGHSLLSTTLDVKPLPLGQRYNLGINFDVLYKGCTERTLLDRERVYSRSEYTHAVSFMSRWPDGTKWGFTYYYGARHRYVPPFYIVLQPSQFRSFEGMLRFLDKIIVNFNPWLCNMSRIDVHVDLPGTPARWAKHVTFPAARGKPPHKYEGARSTTCYVGNLILYDRTAKVREDFRKRNPGETLPRTLRTLKSWTRLEVKILRRRLKDMIGAKGNLLRILGSIGSFPSLINLELLKGLEIWGPRKFRKGVADSSGEHSTFLSLDKYGHGVQRNGRRWLEARFQKVGRGPLDDLLMADFLRFICEDPDRDQDLADLRTRTLWIEKAPPYRESYPDLTGSTGSGPRPGRVKLSPLFRARRRKGGDTVLHPKSRPSRNRASIESPGLERIS